MIRDADSDRTFKALAAILDGRQPDRDVSDVLGTLGGLTTILLLLITRNDARFAAQLLNEVLVTAVEDGLAYSANKPLAMKSRRTNDQF